MAGNDTVNQEDINNPSNVRRSSDLLPGYHRTDKNVKFLASTLDQFIQQPQLERINGFVGSKLSLNYDPATDTYIDGGSTLRNAYQLEPSLVVKDVNHTISRSVGYDDLINQLQFSNANTSNLDRLFRPESVSYDPNIDWDKFVNYRQYYWLPTGPDSIEITGHQKSVVTTYTVVDSADGKGLLFTPDGLTVTPLLTLYRGITYTFKVTSKYPFYIKTAYVKGKQNLYTNVLNQGSTNGSVTITVDDTTPNVLFYFAEGNDYAIGQIAVKALTADTVLDVDKEIIGKQTYGSTNGVTFSNGMKVHFTGNITPSSYIGKEWIVEGVGSSITLVDYDSLSNAGTYTTNLDPNFDATPFDHYPFDDFNFIPLIPEYITINRASPDKNSWSRYNRWVHRDVIAAAAVANGVTPVYDSSARAQRPIIEFNAGLQLFNFGAQAKDNVDLIDTTTKSAFSVFEGSPGFYVDGVLVEHGFRVIFNADTDQLVNGRIYNVKYVTVNGNQIVNLEEAEDSMPMMQNSVVVTRGDKHSGTNWWYNGTSWIFGQQKTSLNQPPLFNLYDENGNEFSDQNFYNSSFKGTEIFGYAVGTGTPDTVLGFPLQYKNVANIGDYLFKNYFTTDTFNNFSNGELTILTVAGHYLKVNTATSSYYKDVWVDKIDQSIPIIQFQVVEQDSIYVEINAIDAPGHTSDLVVDVFVNDTKLMHNIDYRISRDKKRAYVVSTTTFKTHDRVQINLYTAKTPNSNGYYDVPVNLTNNPLNGPISDFTFTELSDHVTSIVNSNRNFMGTFPGAGNLRDLSNLSAYGSRLVSHKNPISFAHYFLGTKDNNLLDSVRKVSFDYSQFKSNLIKQIALIKDVGTSASMLDQAISAINSSKDSTFSYGFSDMIAYGTSHSDRTYTVTSKRNVQYSLESVFDTTVLSERAVLVYLNGVLLVKDRDYVVNQYTPSIEMLISLNVGDTIVISDYSSTVGNYVPPTPTKLGLYPKFVPSIFVDDTYSTPQLVIQGHDGSITLAFGDYRDDVILEFEKRIYNNLKSNYNADLLDIYSIIPGAFRNTGYSLSDITTMLTPDFLKWVGFFGVDFQKNTSFDELNSFTYNYSSDIDTLKKRKLPGHWRGIYKFFYDTDRPHTHPWEMLGFADQPSWWESVYGPAPYTSGNLILWNDLEAGNIAQGNNVGINLLYARPGLSKILPVDDMGNLVSPTDSGLATTPIINANDPSRIVTLRSTLISSNWKIGDQGPAETAWRRSSYWPFACQVLLALAKPATYAAKMFDPSRLMVNKLGQYKYSTGNQFIDLSNVVLYRDTVNSSRALASGYSVFVIETGLSRDAGYLTYLKNDLADVNYNLMAKLGGFASKDKLQVIIDAVDPNSPYPGVLIPLEDYQIFFNQSAPIESIGVSGIIVQKTERGFAVRGYDKFNPYFTVLAPFTSNTGQVDQVGGRSESFVNWMQNTTYNVGQIVFYLDRYYRVTQKHNSDTTFISTYYQGLPYLPTVGGVEVLRRTSFNTSPSIVPYGTEYATIQEVYDLILGYGKWLESKGFVFDQYIKDLDQISDWNFTAKEFLFWTSQNWAINSVITLSPFADKITFNSTQGVVDSLVNNFYEYSVLSANGSPFSQTNFTISRLNGVFTLSTVNTQEGFYFAKLNVVQKEHAIVFNNYTLFNDVVYDIGSGYRQRRINLKGFRTLNWNGDFFSPGFIFDQANVVDWEKFVDYSIGQVVRFSGNYYSAPKSLPGSGSFDFTKWVLLPAKPVSQLYPNFDYKINQFEDFYSLDIDNFDSGQQAAAQNLVGYIPRTYLNNIIGDPIAQYKFYQGYIKEKGTINPLTNLSKSSLNKWQSSIKANEEWAFRIGYYGGYNTYQELETSLDFNKFIENPQIINFVETKPSNVTDAVYYKTPSNIVISPQNFDINNVFSTVAGSYSFDDFQLPVAGYPRFDDIYVTAYNKNSILDIGNAAAIKEGSVFWLGFTQNGDWDVLRYTNIPTVIVNVSLYIPGQTLLLTTQDPTDIAVNDIISVVRIDPLIDKCYVVSEVLSPTEIVVYSTSDTLPTLTSPMTGSLFSFKSSRLPTLNNLHTLPYLENWKPGELIWVDDTGTGKWGVYKKSGNFQAFEYDTGIDNPEQHFGYKVVTSDSTNTFVVSSPNYVDSLTGNRGRIFALQRSGTDTVSLNYNYTVNNPSAIYYTGTSDTLLGVSLAYDSTRRLVIAGAPYASYVKDTDANYVINTLSSTLSFINQGIVQLSVLDEAYSSQQFSQVITTPTPENSATFGTSIAYSSISETNGTILVGAPGYNSNLGAVYKYNLTFVNGTSTVSYVNSTTVVVPNSQLGSAIAGNADLTKYAVSAPGYSSVLSNGSMGAVYVYTSSTSPVQVITGDNIDLPSPFGPGDNFGTIIKMTPDGNFLVVGSPQASDPERGPNSGVVDIFKWVGTQFVHQQRINRPRSSNGIEFGYDIALSTDGNQLVISLTGVSKTRVPTFDTYTERLSSAISTATYGTIYVNDSTSTARNKVTTFDSGSTNFYHGVIDAGSVYTYYRYGDNWAYSQELADLNIPVSSSFGSSLSITESSIYVGAPSLLNSANSGNGQIFIFNKLDNSSTGWASYREQEPLVDLSLIKRASIIDSTTAQTQDYIDIIDPIKGNILGTAKQELKYITSYDPAIYSVGINGTNVNVNSNWLDNHVGELWWDLSSVKYVWYEQGDLEYRKNNWNNIFPGSTVDVYEWVESTYLPSEWSQLADTADGLSKGISGQPRFSGNTVFSVKQVYNSISNAFTNVYYYWVKNKNTLPMAIKNRRMTALNVASQIANPVGSGNKFLSILGPTSLMIANSKNLALGDQYNLNIEFDNITDAAKRHTEWELLQENDANSKPNALLEKKLIDSLLGHDILGNPVPDTTLPTRLRYGVEIRPRQGLFVNRLEALRNLIEFTNSTLLNLQITGQISFANLDAKEPLPDSSTYDKLVEDFYTLELIPTALLKTAVLTAIVDSNGKITGATVVEPGYGYLTPPTITVSGSGTSGELVSIIDAKGRVTGATVKNAGTGYLEVPLLTVRPFTTVVQTDLNSNGKWAVYTWNPRKKAWIKNRTQDYDTAVYWNYVDWSSTDYNPLAEIFATVSSPYGLFEYETTKVGTYVKVMNGGDSRYLILRRTEGTGGTFDDNWDLVYSQNGTIQFSSALWDLRNTIYAWDEYAGWDQTEYDQTPDKELFYILTALKDDIFINAYKIYWNQFFFKAVRYAFSEQKSLDWAFKTTFISVDNSLGSLDQKHTYKLQNSVNYENFLEEIKPYHTKIRRFTESYTSTELTRSFTTDFDLPSYYSTLTQNFSNVGFGNNLLLQYPWKSWYENYSYGIESIYLQDGGENYTSVPTVSIIPAHGDKGHGATAVAHISLGKVTNIIVTNPGSGYTTNPTVILNGGGSISLKPAKAYAKLGVNNVRKNNITLKFDRISKVREIGNQYYTDTFTGDGKKVSYNLTWAPVPEKSLITLKVNGVLKLLDDFSIMFAERKYDPQSNTSYTKKYATLELTFVPLENDKIEIIYPKDISLYNALDRIGDYYEPTSGMPGKDPNQLMLGMSYNGLIVDTLPFSAAGGWDVVPFGSANWDNYSLESGYVSFAVTTSNTQTFVLSGMTIPAGTQVNTYINGTRVDGRNKPVPTITGKGTGAVDYITIQGGGAGYSNGTTVITLSAPDITSGTQATAVATIVEGVITTATIINQGSGYINPPYVTISGSSTVQAYAAATLKAEFTETSTTTIFNSITIPSRAFTSTNSLVVFRYASSDGTLQITDLNSLDAYIDGGNMSYTTALGLTPSEIILDGGSTSTQSITGMNDDGFLNPFNSPAPEECVPGQVQEAVGISVYTEPYYASPVIVNKKYWINGIPGTYQLGITPVNSAATIALFNDVRLLTGDYTIDYANNTFSFTSVNTVTGWLSLTSMQLGSIKLLDSYADTITAPGTTYQSFVQYSDIGSNGTSSYVTINGSPAIQGEDYTVTADTATNEAVITFNQIGVVQAYLFGGPVKSFSEVNEQIIEVSTSTNSFVLTQPPGNVAPFHSQVIVTKNGVRLNPPVTTYYQVANGQTAFDISQSIVYPKRSIALKRIEVYVNGTRSPVPGIWRLDQKTNQVVFSTGALADGDVIAIVVKKDHDYIIENNQLILSTNSATHDEIRITSFTNHDPDFIRTERFNGQPTNQYRMQRPILNSAYVWVSYNGSPLSLELDYKIDPDGYTVVIREGIFQSLNDDVVITSFATTIHQATSYRIFKDMLGRTHYKRLSNDNSTFLTAELYTTSTSITVNDSSVLTIPDPRSNIPGVILVEGERIEFFTVTGNVLGQLRRSTLGTAPKSVYSTGTLVIDQGVNQTVPFNEVVQVYTTATTTASSYTLSGITFNNSAAYSDQIEVRYQGKPLLKPGLSTISHNFDLAYDSTSTADTVVTSQFSITTGSVLTLNFAPVAGATLEVVKRSSQIWYQPNSTFTLSENNTPQVSFLLERSAASPDKYRYE